MNELLDAAKEMGTDIYTWMTVVFAWIVGWYTYVKATYADATKDMDPKRRRVLSIFLGFLVFALIFAVITAVF